VNRGEQDLPFRELEPDLTALLKEFGPPRQSYHPEYPFWRLQNDRVWAVRADAPLAPRQGNTDPLKSELLPHDARGNFTPDVQIAGPQRVCVRPRREGSFPAPPAV
jgi:putative restriction endonuclease